ncbi:MAG: hypothetical protein OD918_07325 [Gammaproteobacteria bacterium]
MRILTRAHCAGRIARAAALALAIAGLGGCLKSVRVTFFQPGVYQDAPEPLPGAHFAGQPGR